VSATVSTDAGEVLITRGADDPAPRASAEFPKPIIFSQKEIESLGLTDAGRLQLLDGFLINQIENRRREDVLATSIKSIQRDIENRVREIDNLATALPTLPALLDQLVAAQQRQVAQQGDSVELAAKHSELANLGVLQANHAVTEGSLARFTKLVDDWIEALVGATNLAGADSAPADRPDPLAPYRSRLSAVREDTVRSIQALHGVRGEVINSLSVVVQARLSTEAQAHTLRNEVEALADGAGALAREISALQGKIAELQAVESIVVERWSDIADLRSKRDALLTDLDKAREARFIARSAAAARINAALNPRIQVKVERYARYSDYIRAIVEALRGSNLKYNDLSITIAEALSPPELLRIVEGRDFDALALALALPKERAARIIVALADAGLGDIAVCDVEDNAKFLLLDGPDYKDISALSAGQRCTVILPIVLQHDERTLIIDQPEDHIDNAFIADTLIKALRARAGQSQLIVSTHNANIPVLGEASLVIEMVSDGRQGTVQVREALEHPNAVNAITTVMEGGEAAFENRARFYKDHHA